MKMGRARSATDLQPHPALLARPIHSILVIKPRAIGDVLLSTVVTPNLRSAFPEARIHFLTESPAADIIRGNSHIDEAIIFHPGKDSFVRLLWRLYRERYDLVFDLFCNPRTAQFTAATRAALRVGYPFRGRAWAYNVHVETRADHVHNTQFNLDPLRQLGIPIVSESPVFPLDGDARGRMRELASSFRKRSGPLIALNPSGTWETKRWPLAHFAVLADRLIDACDANILLLWGPGEEKDVAAIAHDMTHEAVIPPKTTIRELGAMLASCDFMISNDAGPMHISAAVGIPTLGIFGPTNPHLQGPWNARSGWVRLEELDCLACNLTSCPIGNICMRDLPVESVLRAFQQLQTGQRT
jgi:ADP-heptose:LPS heptosyltransferase